MPAEIAFASHRGAAVDSDWCACQSDSLAKARTASEKKVSHELCSLEEAVQGDAVHRIERLNCYNCFLQRYFIVVVLVCSEVGVR